MGFSSLGCDEVQYAELNCVGHLFDVFFKCEFRVQCNPEGFEVWCQHQFQSLQKTCHLLNLVDCLLNTIQTVFFVLSMMRHKSHNQTCTLGSALVSLDDMVSLPCVTIAASNGTIQSNFT